MDEYCEDFSDIQQLEEDLCGLPDDEDDEDIDDDQVSTSKSLTDEKAEENPNSGNALDISVKLEVGILEGEDNQNSNKVQQVNEARLVTIIITFQFYC